LYIPAIEGSVASPPFEGTTFTLLRNISAIQAISGPEASVRLGTILQLPEGTQVRVCGDGFNERTVKVAWEGAYYFIFWEDLDADWTLRTRAYAAGKS
jgi:hypothetical protein